MSAPPAPPPLPPKHDPIPPFGPGSILAPVVRGRNPSQPNRNSFKSYHWQTFGTVIEGTLWDDVQKYGEANKVPKIDISELEDLFVKSIPAKIRSKHRAKSEKVQLIDHRRAINCELLLAFLARKKLPLPDLMKAILALDDSILQIEHLESLISCAPKEDDIIRLKEYSGDPKNLGSSEEFLLEMMKIPRVELKLCAFIFKMQFNYKIADQKNKLTILNSICEEVRCSEKFRRIMQTVLQLGNAMNQLQETVPGSAVGIRLDSLMRLTEIRAKSNETTLMHYLCKVVAQNQPEIVDFFTDFPTLELALKLQLKNMIEEIQTINEEMEQVSLELILSENDGPMSENFCKTLKQFLSFARDEMKSLDPLYSDMGRNADILVTYFGENPKNYPFEQVILTLRIFVKKFVKAHEENCELLEFKMRRIQREVERARIK